MISGTTVPTDDGSPGDREELSVKVFGFGSFFLRRADARDIDLLVVHENTSSASCRFALKCRRELARLVHDAHVTLLAESEEIEKGFVQKSQARLLGCIAESNLASDIEELCRRAELPQT